MTKMQEEFDWTDEQPTAQGAGTRRDKEQGRVVFNVMQRDSFSGTPWKSKHLMRIIEELNGHGLNGSKIIEKGFLENGTATSNRMEYLVKREKPENLEAALATVEKFYKLWTSVNEEHYKKKTNQSP